MTRPAQLPADAPPLFHSHDRPRCVDCGAERGPWRPTGDHCEHDIQTFWCLPCAEAAAQ